MRLTRDTLRSIIREEVGGEQRSAYRAAAEALTETQNINSVRTFTPKAQKRILRRLSDRQGNPNGQIYTFASFVQFNEALGLSSWRDFASVYSEAIKKSYVKSAAERYYIALGDPNKPASMQSGEPKFIYQYESRYVDASKIKYNTIYVSPPNSQNDYWKVALGGGGGAGMLDSMYGDGTSDHVREQLSQDGVRL